jgi:hypothetical protein
MKVCRKRKEAAEKSELTKTGKKGVAFKKCFQFCLYGVKYTFIFTRYQI